MSTSFSSKIRHLATATPAVLLFATVLAAFQAPEPAKAKPEIDPQKATVAGKVVDGVTGKPVKDANLLLVNATGGSLNPSTAKAGEEGEFNFRNQEPGTYVLMADHPRYARQTYGSRNGILGGTMLTLTMGQSLSKLEFKLQPNAVASGRVLDPDGDPIQGVMVAALKPMYQRGKRQFLPVGTGVSNDLGEYRLANLAAGRYLIVAIVMNPATAVTKTAEGQENVYMATYYPNLSDPAGAGQVEIDAGRDVAGMDIRMAKTKAVRVKGKVIGAAENQKVTVQLVPRGVGLLAMLTARSTQVKMPEGTFEIAGASRGSYTVRAMDPQAMMKPLGQGVQIEISDRAIDGVMVDVTPAADLAGVVALKGDNKDKQSVKGARIILEAAEGVSAIPPMTSVAEDGTFTLKGVPPDKYFVRIMNGPAAAFVESVKLGSQEMPDEGLMLGGAASGKIDIKLNTSAAQVEGVVNGADDKPMSGATVALIPSSRKYLLYNTTFTDQNGAFSFKSVTPGEYKVIAWEQVEPNAYQDPEFLKPYESKGESASLKEGERKAVTLKAIPR